MKIGAVVLMVAVLGAAGPAQACVTDVQAINARWSDRELALSIAEDSRRTAQERFDTVRAAAVSLGDPSACADDMKSDVVFLELAANAFTAPDASAQWLQLVQIAVRLDQRLPTRQRRLNGYALSEPLGTLVRAQMYAQLAGLATLLRGDERLAPMAGQLVSRLYFDASVWREGVPRDQLDRSATDLLALMQQLYGFSCPNCMKEWQWKPMLQVAIAYQRRQLPAQAQQHARDAIALILSMQEIESRLASLGSVLTELLVWRFDQALAVDVAQQVRALAASGSGPHAREWRERLPDLQQRFGFTLP